MSRIPLAARKKFDGRGLTRYFLSPLGTTDLHGLYVQEAIERTEQRVKQAQSQGRPTLRVITGKGVHSAQHVAKIRPAIEKLMQQSVPIAFPFLLPFADVAPLFFFWDETDRIWAQKWIRITRVSSSFISLVEAAGATQGSRANWHARRRATRNSALSCDTPPKSLPSVRLTFDPWISLYTSLILINAI